MAETCTDVATHNMKHVKTCERRKVMCKKILCTLSASC